MLSVVDDRNILHVLDMELICLAPHQGHEGVWWGVKVKLNSFCTLDWYRGERLYTDRLHFWRKGH